LLQQDAALLRREYPHHDIFKDPLFETGEYIQFEEDVAVAVGAAREEDPQLTVIQKAIPAVCDRLRTIAGAVQTGLESNNSSIRRVEGTIRRVEERLATVEHGMSDFCSGVFNLTFTPGNCRAQQQQPQLPSLPLPGLPNTTLSAMSIPTLTAIESLAEEPPIYQLSRGIKTIPDLWREWTVGLGGQLSVEALDERWRSRWRRGAEFQFYSRRKVIIDEIKRLVAEGREVVDAVNSLEEARLRSKSSLSQVVNTLKVAAKARGC